MTWRRGIRSGQAGGRCRRLLVRAAIVVLAVAACEGGPAPSPRASSSAAPTQTLALPTAASTTVMPTLAASEAPTSLPTSGPTSAPTARPTLTPLPTAKPSATPSSPTPSPAPPSSLLIRHGARTGNDVALTFDMGGRVGDALEIMRWLVDHGVHASVFMTGAMADNQNTDAGRGVLAIVEEHPDLFTLGNHSYTHRDFRNLTAGESADELRRTEAAISPYCSQDMRPFFRPPFGGVNADVLAAVGAAGYRKTVAWDIDTIDWRPIVNDPPGPTADEILTKVLANVQGGSIVLMHLGGYETFTALPGIVNGLRDAGYDLVTLDEMLGA